VRQTHCERRWLHLNLNHYQEFIYSSIKKWGIKTDKYFGFYDDCHPENEQRVGGFCEGRWALPQEFQFMEEMKEKLGETKKKSGLYKNEADIALAARSSDSIAIVLTRDKTGPLKFAKDRGWCVVDLNDFDASSGSFYEFVAAQC